MPLFLISMFALAIIGNRQGANFGEFLMLSIVVTALIMVAIIAGPFLLIIGAMCGILWVLYWIGSKIKIPW